MKARVRVDFNEMLSAEVVLLAKNDSLADSQGNMIELSEGMHVLVYSEDEDDRGDPDNLIAEGRARRNTSSGWSAHVPWVLKIDPPGIRHQSEDPEA